ncbi:hypothetical protein HWV62_36318, partial [Athelia sp. TMB]
MARPDLDAFSLDDFLQDPLDVAPAHPPAAWPGYIDPSMYNIPFHLPPGLAPGYYNVPQFPLAFPGTTGGYNMAPPGFPFVQTPLHTSPYGADNWDNRRDLRSEGGGHGDRRTSRCVRQQDLDDAKTQIRDLERVTRSLIEELDTYRQQNLSPTSRGRSISRSPIR